MATFKTSQLCPSTSPSTSLKILGSQVYGKRFPIRTGFIEQIIFPDKRGFIGLSSRLCRQGYEAFRPLATPANRRDRGLPARLTLWVAIAGMGGGSGLTPAPHGNYLHPKEHANGTYANNVGAAGPWGGQWSQGRASSRTQQLCGQKGCPFLISCSF